MTQKYTMEVDQGSHYEIVLTITDCHRDPIDLTGHVFSGQIRKSVTDTAIQASFTFELLDQAVAITKGKVKVKLLGASSTAIVLSSQKEVERKKVEFAYDIESVLAGVPVRWLEGNLLLNPEVTK